ncbi:MAG: dTMP kinase [Acidimicrobiales bacterium]
MSARGRLVALEGIDGCGKSTQARRLAQTLGAKATHEPGGTALGREVRSLVLRPGASLDPRAEALLMAADRAQHVAEVIAPALGGGHWVVTDRFSASTLAYQGYGRGMDVEELDRLVRWAAGGLAPDLVVLLDVPVAVAAARRRSHGADRLEALGGEFQQRVAAGFAALAEADPTRWVVVDGTKRADEVASATLAAVIDRLGWPDGAAVGGAE